MGVRLSEADSIYALVRGLLSSGYDPFVWILEIWWRDSQAIQACQTSVATGGGRIAFDTPRGESAAPRRHLTHLRIQLHKPVSRPHSQCQSAGMTAPWQKARKAKKAKKDAENTTEQLAAAAESSTGDTGCSAPSTATPTGPAATVIGLQQMRNLCFESFRLT
jgi:hypothetical protein